MRSQLKIVPASRGGWVQNASLIEPVPYGAEVLDNWFPTADGIRLRLGTEKHASAGASVKQMMVYAGGQNADIFAATTNAVFDVTAPADPDVAPTADITGLTSGDWAYVNFGNSAGTFLWMVNGADDARHYNGTTWATPTITNVSSADLSHAWVFKSRIFAVEGGKLSAWYLPVDAVAGAATEFPLGAIFSQGGSLLFGATWSLDAGDGLDDSCVFVTTEGEVAVYQGTDPASASTFALVGVYQIARPLSKHAWFKAGGDIAIATEDGVISLAAAVQQDRAALSRSAITYPIEDAWRTAVTLRTSEHRFSCTLWHSQTMLMISVPDDYLGTDQVFVANARTGAWCRYTGWDVQCSVVADDRLYFGTLAGTVQRGETTGQDDATPYTAYWLPRHDGGGEQKSLLHARVTYRGNIELGPDLSGAINYEVEYPPPAPSMTDETGAVWGAAIWGESVWGERPRRAIKTEWQTVRGTGQAVSVWCSATSARTTNPDASIISLEYLCEPGTVI